MRKILCLLMLTALFVSCSSDDDNTDPNNGNGNNNGMIDEKIIGKWKVEYSKTIKPAVYNETTGKPEYNEDATIKEYEGNFGEPNIVPESSMFGDKDVWINIKNDNSIAAYHTGYPSTGYTPKTVTYKIENGLLKWQTKAENPYGVIKYSLDGNILVMEIIKAENTSGGATHLGYYTISRYSKITE